MNRCYRIFGLAACVLAFASPGALAGIKLGGREAIASARALLFDNGVLVGVDDPDPEVQVDLLPANLSRSAAVGGASGSGHVNSSITVDAGDGTLRFTFIGGASATKPANSGTLRTEGRGDGSDQFSFTLTDVSYTYTLTGHVSGTSVNAAGFGTAEIDFSGHPGFFPDFLINGDRDDEVPVSDSGTLAPGGYSIDIRTFSEVTSQGGSASVTVNIVLTVRPVGAPTPSPIQWNNPAGGSFDTATNWDPQTVPGTSDTASFSLSSLYNVDIGAATTERLQVQSGGVTFTNANYTVTAGGSAPPSILIDSGLLVLAGGSVSGVQGLIGQGGGAAVEVQSGATLSLITLGVGGAGEGDLDIRAGGSVFTSGCVIGSGVGGGTVNVNGPNAIFDSGTLVIGSGSFGTLGLADAALLTSSVGTVGSGPNSGSIFITGAGSRWTLGDELNIQEGIVSVQDGGVLDAQQSVDIGIASGQSGHLEMLLGGLVQTPNCTVWGGFLGVNGQGTASSRLDVVDLLSLGGLLDSAKMSTSAVETEIGGGGTIVAQRVALGDYLGTSVANLTISGIGSNGQPSSLNVAGASSLLLVSGAPGTLLEVKDGGRLSTSASSKIGSEVLSGRVLVHGSSGLQPSIWSTSDEFLEIGSQVVPSELAVLDGGVVTGDSAIILAPGFRELGQLTISGGDSSLSAGEIVVGEEGDGVISISDGGHVTVGLARVGAPTSPDSTRGTGLVTIQGTPLSSSEWHVTGNCIIGDTEPGTVRLEGTTIGPISVGGATLTVDTTLTVGSKGVVLGNGTLTAAHLINNGFINPGLSPGVIAINGAYEQGSTGLLQMEAAGLNPGEFDVLQINGDVTLGGRLTMQFLNGYLPRAGDVLPVLQASGNANGQFAEITFPQLLPGFQIGAQFENGTYKVTAINDAVLAPTSLLNISTRMHVGTDDNVLIGGFILLGNEPKQVVIRAIGPSLTSSGIIGVLADPTLELHDSTGAVIASNDNWPTTQLSGLITTDQVAQLQASSLAPISSAESAIILTLGPGGYTAIIRGADGTTGVALVEIYDLSGAVPSKLANISTRGFVDIGDNVMIGGFIIGNQTTRVLARALGPSLASVAGALTDPILDLRDGQGALIMANDDWRETQQADIKATGIPPSNNLESAIIAELTPGAYTAIVRGSSNATGVGLVEVYNLP